MSTGGPNTQRFSPFTPPLRGSFPLDHDHKCSELVGKYLECVKLYQQQQKKLIANEGQTDDFRSATTMCRLEARSYLECRMRSGLMREEELKALGFDEGIDGQRAEELKSHLNNKG